MINKTAYRGCSSGSLYTIAVIADFEDSRALQLLEDIAINFFDTQYVFSSPDCACELCLRSYVEEILPDELYIDCAWLRNMCLYIEGFKGIMSELIESFGFDAFLVHADGTFTKIEE